MTDIQRKILEHWDAWIYEQEEDETEMAEYLVKKLGRQPMKIFEAGCGGGKLCAPLAQAGHDVTGVDRNENMLAYARKRAEELPNLHVSQADMLTTAWGKDFDAVVLGANLMNNIEGDWEDKRAQKRLIERAYESLRMGGRLFIDFDCPLHLSTWLPANHEWVCFDGADDAGTFGRYIVIDGAINDRTRTLSGGRRWEITPKGGERFVYREEYAGKHFPSVEEVFSWLYRIGFAVESLHGGYRNEPFDREHRRAVIWARKIAV